MDKTIIERMCDIDKGLRGSDGPCRLEISEESLSKAEGDIAPLRELLSMNTMQVIILMAILQKSGRYRSDCEDIAASLGMEYLRFMTYNKDIKELRRLGYIRMDEDGAISISSQAKKCLFDNKPLIKEKTTGLDTVHILIRIKDQLGIRKEGEMESSEVISEVDTLMKNNPDTSIAQVYLGRLANSGANVYERLFFTILLFFYYFHDEDSVSWYDAEAYFAEFETDLLKADAAMDSMALQRKGLVEYAGEDGMLAKDRFKIKDEVLNMILSDCGGLRRRSAAVSSSTRISAGSIIHKDLFYNPAEGRQIEQLRMLVSEDRFSEVRARMKDEGFRTGFTCLFYGAPGTGKTETVYQLARECGRDLFVVDVSQVKSCWHGESEKNIKDVFTKYRQSLNSGERTPILLFNEADAIFGIRKEGADSSIERMENSIQNIILQEMDDLDGILIATTNLTSNFDKAFERRFLYKVRFDKPSAEASSHIWRMKIPELSESETARLVAEYRFSGGQIENIARKRKVNSVLYGNPPSFEQILQYCSEETIGEQDGRRKIGF